MTTEEKARAYAESVIDSFGTNGVPCGIKDIKHMITEGYFAGATEALASQWVSVEDRLPEFNERVVVRCVEYGRPSMFIAQRIPHDTADRNNTRWHWTQVMRDESITHWLPIPPLKGGDA